MGLVKQVTVPIPTTTQAGLVRTISFGWEPKATRAAHASDLPDRLMATSLPRRKQHETNVERCALDGSIIQTVTSPFR